MNEPKWFWKVLCFVVPFVLVCTGGAALAGSSALGIVFLVAGLVVLFAVWAKLLNEKGRALLPWKWDGAELAGLAGLGAGVLVVGGMMVLCSMHDPHVKRLSTQANILAVQTLVLAITAGFVIWYAWEARRTAQATEELIWAQLAGRAGLFVKSISPASDGDWLKMELKNEGKYTAFNVQACASWTDPIGHAAAAQGEWSEMKKKEDDLDESDRKQHGTRRAWQLGPSESRFFYLRPPKKPTETDPKKGPCLGLIWFGTGYNKWTSWILLQKEKDDDKWSQNWLWAKPLRGPSYCWPQAEGGGLPKGDTDEAKRCGR